MDTFFLLSCVWATGPVLGVVTVPLDLKDPWLYFKNQSLVVVPEMLPLTYIPFCLKLVFFQSPLNEYVTMERMTLQITD